MKTYLQKRGARDKSLQLVHEMGEFLTDINRDEEIDMNHRTKRQVILWIVEAAKSCGDRAKMVHFPMDYNISGPWQFDTAGVTTTVTDMVNKASIEIQTPRGAELYLDLAYSHVRCKLRARGNKFQKDLCLLFQAKFVAAERLQSRSTPQVPSVFASRVVMRRRSQKRAAPRERGLHAEEKAGDKGDQETHTSSAGGLFAIEDDPAVFVAGGASSSGELFPASPSNATAVNAKGNKIASKKVREAGGTIERFFCPPVPYGLG